jgi:hypothetical protein
MRASAVTKVLGQLRRELPFEIASKGRCKTDEVMGTV